MAAQHDNKHLTVDQLRAYVDGTLGDEAAYEAADEHVLTCHLCREFLAQPSQSLPLTLATALLEALHPTEDEIELYAVEGKFAVTSSIAAHIDDCARCASDVSFLQQQRERRRATAFTSAPLLILETPNQEAFSPDSTLVASGQQAALPSVEPGNSVPENWAQKWLNSLRTSLKPQNLAVRAMPAFGFAVLILVLFWNAQRSVTRVLEIEARRAQEQIAVLKQDNQALRAQVQETSADIKTRLAQYSANQDTRARESQARLERKLTALANSLPRSVSPENHITPGPPPQRAFALQDGATTWQLQNGRLTGAPNLNSATREAITTAMSRGIVSSLSGMIPPPQMSDIGNRAPLTLDYPVRQPVRNADIRFQWITQRSRVPVKVTVYDAEGTEVAVSNWLTSSTWMLPENEKAILSPGRAYSWTVTTRPEDSEANPTPQRQPFWLLSAESSQQLQRAQQQAQGSHLRLLLAYRQFGLWADAAHELDILQEANPNLDTLQTLRRNLNEEQQRR